MNNKKEYLSISFRGGPSNRFYEYHTATYLAKIWRKEFVIDPSKILAAGMHHDPNFKITDFFECGTMVVPKYHTVIRQCDKKERINPNWKDDLLEMDIPRGNVLLADGWYQTFWDNHLTVPRLPICKIDFDVNKSIFVHVRRGDYLRCWLNVDLTNYYKLAYEKSEQIFSDSTYLICSDDIKWCKKYMKYINLPYFLENADYKETLWLMSQCKRGAILANSSYSLWGAYLARINNKFRPSFKSFLPGRWSNDGNENGRVTAKYICPSWVEKIEI